MGIGRLGNFIDGQIAGSITDVCWAVRFPDLEGFRHPVVLYDGLKNLLLVPVLLYLRSRRPPRGIVLGHFILWYGFLRIFVDQFREYRTDLLGLPPGQEFNILMSVVGLVLIVWAHKTQGRERALGLSGFDRPECKVHHARIIEQSDTCLVRNPNYSEGLVFQILLTNFHSPSSFVQILMYLPCSSTRSGP